MYCVFGLQIFGEQGVTLAASKGRVIVADTLEQARDYALWFGGDRLETWDASRETCWFSPLLPQHVSGVKILTDYDPYHTPPNAPARSETQGREWKHHVHVVHVFHDCGQIVRRKDGTFANLALGES